MTNKRCTHWIGGKPWTGQGRVAGDIYNPATGQITGTVDFASAVEVDAAVQAAAAAFAQWRETSLVKRASVMFAFRELVREHSAELAELISSEHGKVVSDAAGEVARGLEVVEFACGMPHLLKGGFSENVSAGVDAYSIRQPLGVVAGVTPFNFPAMVPMWMFPIAIAAGNTFVLKPSEKDPSASVRLAELLADAGLPDGVFNVVHGGKDAVDALLAHPDVAAVSFVGSTPIARYIYETGTAVGKRVQALGGAKNHMVVLPDADLDLAADAAVSAGFGSAGERCMAISALVAVDPIGDELVSKIGERVAKLRVGPGDQPESEMGPLVTKAHRDKVASYLDSGVADGATLAVDGRTHPNVGPADGFWLGPSVLDHVRPGMSCYTDEIFGPVLTVVRASSYEQAVAVVNANPYGNGTAIFTSDGGAARRFTHEIEVGMVGINVPIPVPMAFYSFGGWKSSLFGDTHAYGTEGVHFYTRGKAVTARWLDPSHGGVSLGFPVSSRTRNTMTYTPDPARGVEVYAADRAHVFHSWSAQKALQPLAIAHTDGCYVWDFEGNRYLDFSSQLVNTNIGHQHPRVTAAIAEQASKLTTIAPQYANEVRGQAAARLAALAPDGMNKVFFTNGGADANENAIRMARLHTSRDKVLSFYRSYHGNTGAAITSTGDPRRWPNEYATGHVHFFGPYLYRSSFWASTETEESQRALEHLEQVITFEGPDSIAAILIETIVGTAGVLVPPPGYIAGIRALADKYGIVWIADEVMCGFGRAGKWFAFEHFGAVPDLITFAKGSNSGYVPAGGVIISDEIAATFDERVFPGGLTYSGHPLACASIVATIDAMRDEGIVENAWKLGTQTLGPGLAELADRHPVIGEVRGLGVFWALDLVSDRGSRTMLAPYGGSSEAMNVLTAACRSRGLLTFTNYNRLHVVPPCVITHEQAKEGLAILDEALTLADEYCQG